MCSAPTEIAGKRSADVVFCRFRLFSEERDGTDDHAAGAVPTLRHLLSDERGLHWMRCRDRSETFKGDDRLALHIRNCLKAGSRRAPVEENAAGAALAEVTSEFGRGKPQSAQAVKQWLIRIRRLDRALDPVDTKPEAGHGAPLTGETMRIAFAIEIALQKSEPRRTVAGAN